MMNNWFLKQLKEHKSLLLLILLLSVFRSSFADWNVVPTGSMKPTILEGDRILVNKMAYDIRIPFTQISIYKKSDPVRGDIVVFDSEFAGIKLVKSVIGMPGDVIELDNNVLRINGEQLSYEELSSTLETQDLSENLLGLEHVVRVNKGGSSMSSFRSVTVPSDYFLVLGDNRDNSSDSRVIGYVPRSEIVGRTKRVVMSFDYDNYYIPRSNRYFQALVS